MSCVEKKSNAEVGYCRPNERHRRVRRKLTEAIRKRQMELLVIKYEQ